MMLNREQILAADDLKSEVVPVAEWGGEVRVRMLTGAENEALSRALMRDGKPDAARWPLLLVSACMVGDDGNPIFGIDEVAYLEKKSRKALQRVYEVAERLNGVTEKAVAEAEKNSAGGQTGASSSDGQTEPAASPENSSPQ